MANLHNKSIPGNAEGSSGSTHMLEAPQRVLSTLNKDGSRRWIRPRTSPGRFLVMRRWMAIVLIFIFTATPYFSIGGKPAILLDITTRHFTIFGATFLPTDTVLLALFMVGVFVTIFLLTALFGRVWCGWACPQTVYMEFVFRPIERLFDGPPGRRRLAGFRGSAFATLLKYMAFLIVSVYLAHTFLAYFVGVTKLAHWVRQSPFEHPTGFVVMLCTTALMMFDFCYFREQTCIVACPYGRFQSALLDGSSLIISYDEKRGEPRGRMKRAIVEGGSTSAMTLPVLVDDRAQHTMTGRAPQQPPRGDCIDCSMCVTTCPTGIDIRDGLQMECIGCAQCIDACDEVMSRIGRPRGLIRYSSQRAMAGERRRIIRPRVVLYPLMLSIVSGLFALALAGRGAADVTVLRGLGQTFIELPSGEIANQLRIKIVNRTESRATFAISAEGVPGLRVESSGSPVTLEPGAVNTIPIMAIAPASSMTGGSCEITIVVQDGGQFQKKIPYRLLGPGTSSASTQGAQKGGRP